MGDKAGGLRLGVEMGLGGGVGWDRRLMWGDRVGDKAGGQDGGVWRQGPGWVMGRGGGEHPSGHPILQGDEPSDSILLPQPLHKAKPGTAPPPHPPIPSLPPVPPAGLSPRSLCPGFALLLARDAPHLPLPGGSSPPAEDEDLSPHAV